MNDTLPFSTETFPTAYMVHSTKTTNSIFKEASSQSLRTENDHS